MENSSKYVGHISHSPQRKHLVKKMLSYFDKLEAERGDVKDKKKKRSPSQKRSKSRSKSKRGDFQEYDHRSHHHKKMATLKNLMKTELDRAEDGQLDAKVGTLEESKYVPTFMQGDESDSTHKPDASDLKNELGHVLERAEEVVRSQAASVVSSSPSEGNRSVSKSHFSQEGEEGEENPEDKLYYLEVNKKYKHKNDNEEKKFDYHQRKSKEIRRLQYSASIRENVKRKKDDRNPRFNRLRRNGRLTPGGPNRRKKTPAKKKSKPDLKDQLKKLDDDMNRESVFTEEPEADEKFIVYMKSDEPGFEESPQAFRDYQLFLRSAEDPDNVDSYEIKEGEPVELVKQAMVGIAAGAREISDSMGPLDNFQEIQAFAKSDPRAMEGGNSSGRFLDTRRSLLSQDTNPLEEGLDVDPHFDLPERVYGVVTKPLKSERCDFIVVDDSGIRHRIFIEKRQKPAPVPKPKPKPQYREFTGRLLLAGTQFDPTNCIKAVFCRKRGDFKPALIKRVKGRIVKVKVLDEPGMQIEKVYLETTFKLTKVGKGSADCEVRCFEIDQRMAGRTPRMIYFIDGEHHSINGGGGVILPKAVVGQDLVIQPTHGRSQQARIVRYSPEDGGFVVKVQDPSSPDMEYLLIKDPLLQSETGQRPDQQKQQDIEEYTSLLEENAVRKANRREAETLQDVEDKNRHQEELEEDMEVPYSELPEKFEEEYSVYEDKIRSKKDKRGRNSVGGGISSTSRSDNQIEQEIQDEFGLDQQASIPGRITYVMRTTSKPPMEGDDASVASSQAQKQRSEVKIVRDNSRSYQQRPRSYYVESDDEFQEDIEFRRVPDHPVVQPPVEAPKQIVVEEEEAHVMRGIAKVLYDNGHGHKESGEIVGRLVPGSEVVIETISGTVRGTVIQNPSSLQRKDTFSGEDSDPSTARSLLIVDPESSEQYVVLVPEQHLQRETISPSMQGPAEVMSAGQTLHQANITGVIRSGEEVEISLPEEGRVIVGDIISKVRQEEGEGADGSVNLKFKVSDPETGDTIKVMVPLSPKNTRLYQSMCPRFRELPCEVTTHHIQLEEAVVTGPLEEGARVAVSLPEGAMVEGVVVTTPREIMSKNRATGKIEPCIEFKIKDPNSKTGGKMSAVLPRGQLEVEQKPVMIGPALLNDMYGEPVSIKVIAAIKRGAPIELLLGEEEGGPTLQGTILTTPFTYRKNTGKGRGGQQLSKRVTQFLVVDSDTGKRFNVEADTDKLREYVPPQEEEEPVVVFSSPRKVMAESMVRIEDSEIARLVKPPPAPSKKVVEGYAVVVDEDGDSSRAKVKGVLEKGECINVVPRDDPTSQQTFQILTRPKQLSSQTGKGGSAPIRFMAEDLSTGDVKTFTVSDEDDLPQGHKDQEDKDSLPFLTAPARLLREDGRVQRGQFTGQLGKDCPVELQVAKTGEFIKGILTEEPELIKIRDPKTGKRKPGFSLQVLSPDTPENIHVTLLQEDLIPVKRTRQCGACWVYEDGDSPSRGYQGEIEAIFLKGEQAQVTYRGGQGSISGQILSEPKESRRLDKTTNEECDCLEFQVSDPEDGRVVTVVIAKDQIEDIRPPQYIGPARVMDSDFGSKARMCTFIGALEQSAQVEVDQGVRQVAGRISTPLSEFGRVDPMTLNKGKAIRFDVLKDPASIPRTAGGLGSKNKTPSKSMHVVIQKDQLMPKKEPVFSGPCRVRFLDDPSQDFEAVYEGPLVRTSEGMVTPLRVRDLPFKVDITTVPRRFKQKNVELGLVTTWLSMVGRTCRGGQRVKIELDRSQMELKTPQVLNGPSIVEFPSGETQRGEVTGSFGQGDSVRVDVLDQQVPAIVAKGPTGLQRQDTLTGRTGEATKEIVYSPETGLYYRLVTPLDQLQEQDPEILLGPALEEDEEVSFEGAFQKGARVSLTGEEGEAEEAEILSVPVQIDDSRTYENGDYGIIEEVPEGEESDGDRSQFGSNNPYKIMVSRVTDDGESTPPTSIMVNRDDLKVLKPTHREDLSAKIVDTHGSTSYGRIRGVIAKGGDVQLFSDQVEVFDGEVATKPLIIPASQVGINSEGTDIIKMIGADIELGADGQEERMFREFVVIDKETNQRYLVVTALEGEDDDPFKIKVSKVSVPEPGHGESDEEEDMHDGKDIVDERTFENTREVLEYRLGGSPVGQADDMLPDGDKYGAIQLCMDIDEEHNVDFTGYGEVRITRNRPLQEGEEASPEKIKLPAFLGGNATEESVMKFLSPEKTAGVRQRIVEQMQQRYMQQYNFRESSSAFHQDLRNLREMEQDAAIKIQNYWLSKREEREEMQEDGEDSPEVEATRVDNMREMFPNQESYDGFIKFCDSLPEGVDRKKAFEMFEGTLMKLFKKDQ